MDDQLKQAHDAIWAMAEDGWLCCGVEGLSEPQQLVYDYTLKYPQVFGFVLPKDWEVCARKPVHSISANHRGRWIEGKLHCWDCPAVLEPDSAEASHE